MPRLFIFLTLCLAFLAPSSITQAQEVSECAGTLPTRIDADVVRYVRVLPGSPNNLRAAPSVTAEKLGEMPPYAVARILDAPACADGHLWWFIGYPSAEEPAWTAEADATDYWLEPYTHPASEILPVPAVAEGQALAEVSYQGISFSVDPAIAVGVEVEHIFPNYISDAMVSPPTGVPSPDGLRFTLVASDGTTPQIRLSVYSLADFAKLPDGIPDNIGILRTLLDSEGDLERPVNNGSSFLLPGQYPPVLFQDAFQRIAFKNGLGVTYFAEYSFSADPITSLYYSFTGLTDDGLYYVTLEQPVTTPLLPVVDFENFDQEDWDAFYDNFEAYQAGIAESLVSAVPTDFSPDLTSTIALIESLNILAPEDD